MHHEGWLKISPMERQKYDDAARLNGTQAVKFEPIKAELDVKDVLPVSQIDDLPLQPEAQSFQLQSILKDATPERLEGGVEQGVKLLNQLEALMQDKSAGTADACTWMGQIGTYNASCQDEQS